MMHPLEAWSSHVAEDDGSAEGGAVCTLHAQITKPGRLSDVREAIWLGLPELKRRRGQSELMTERKKIRACRTGTDKARNGSEPRKCACLLPARTLSGMLKRLMTQAAWTL